MRRCDHLGWLTGITLLVLLTLAPGAGAQTIYRWTDDRGVVHFGQQPPSNRAAEERRMPKRPPASAENEEKDDEKSTDADAAEDGEESAAPADDDAKPSKSSGAQPSSSQVILDTDENALVGDAVQRFSGRVRNLGRSVARDVVVDILVADGSGGFECLRHRAAVTPADLAPGASGTYAVDLASPCFAGGTRANVQARWN